MEYRAVNKTDPTNELAHWKYIKRYKNNGRWVYVYDDKELKKFEEGATDRVTGKITNRNGEGAAKYERETRYEKTNKLFDSKSKLNIRNSFGDSHYETDIVTKKQGKISRAVAEVEKKIYDEYLSPAASRKKLIKNIQTKRKINKGKQKLKKLFGID